MKPSKTSMLVVASLVTVTVLSFSDLSEVYDSEWVEHGILHSRAAALDIYGESVYLVGGLHDDGTGANPDLPYVGSDLPGYERWITFQAFANGDPLGFAEYPDLDRVENPVAASNNDEALCTSVGTDGKVWVGGYRRIGATNEGVQDAYVAVYDDSIQRGEPLYDWHLSSPLSGDDRVTDILTDGATTAFVLIEHQPLSGTSKVILRRLDISGGSLGSTWYTDESVNNYDVADSATVALAKDDTYIHFILTADGPNQGDVKVEYGTHFKFNGLSTHANSLFQYLSCDTTAKGLAVDSSGTPYIVGYYEHGDPVQQDIVVFGVPNGPDDYDVDGANTLPVGISVDSNDDVWVGGYGTNGDDLISLYYDVSEETRDDETVDFDDDVIGFSSGVDADNRFHVFGYFFSGEGQCRMVIAHWDENHDLTTGVDDTDVLPDELFNSVVDPTSGLVYLTGVERTPILGEDFFNYYLRMLVYDYAGPALRTCPVMAGKHAHLER